MVFNGKPALITGRASRMSRLHAIQLAEADVKVAINKENKKSSLRFLMVYPSAVVMPFINQAKDNGPEFLKHT